MNTPKDILALLPVEKLITLAEREQLRRRRLNVLSVVAITGWLFFFLVCLMK
jgi:ribosomal protein L17